MCKCWAGGRSCLTFIGQTCNECSALDSYRLTYKLFLIHVLIHAMSHDASTSDSSAGLSLSAAIALSMYQGVCFSHNIHSSEQSLAIAHRFRHQCSSIMVASPLASIAAGNTGTVGKSLLRTQASPQYGDKPFKGCPWCRRGRECSNLLQHELRTSPTLICKSDRHYVCIPCLSTSRKTCPYLLLCGRNQTHNDKLTCVQTNADAYLERCLIVQAHAAVKNGVAPEHHGAKRNSSSATENSEAI